MRSQILKSIYYIDEKMEKEIKKMKEMVQKGEAPAETSFIGIKNWLLNLGCSFGKCEDQKEYEFLSKTSYSPSEVCRIGTYFNEDNEPTLCLQNEYLETETIFIPKEAEKTVFGWFGSYDPRWKRYQNGNNPRRILTDDFKTVLCK